MKTKLMVTIFIAVIALIAGCDSLWQVSDTSDVTFTIDTSALQSSRNIQFSQNGVNAIDSDDVSKVTISLHNANDDSEIDSKTETFTDDDDVTIEFINLKIVGKTVYAKAVLETGGEVRTGVSEAKLMVKGSNFLNIVIGEEQEEEQEPVHAVQPVFASTLQSTTYTTNAQAVALNGSATVTDGGTITYQWYRNETNSTIGGTKINGATSETYTPPTDAVGTVYYYVIATNTITDNGDGGVKITSVTSNVATIVVYLFEDYTTTSTNIGMKAIEGGTFAMGNADETIAGTEDERPVHEVTLDSFYLGSTEVTQGQWEAVMGTTWPFKAPEESYGKSSNHPAYNISWYDVIKFCNQLSINEGLEPVYYTGASYPTSVNITKDTNLTEAPNADFAKNGYRLPTEAEWEYAAGGGDRSSRTKYAGTNKDGNVDGIDDLGDYAWYDQYVGGRSNAVKGKKSNDLGLYDMSGNVDEMCWDWYGATYYNTENDNTNNPTGPASGSSRVVRGGHWNYDSSSCRVAYRVYATPTSQSTMTGFRVARSVAP